MDTILRILMTAAPVTLAGLFVQPSHTTRWLTIFATVYGVCVPAWILNRRGYTRTAGVMLDVGLWTAVTAFALTAGGIAAIAPMFYLIFVLVSGMLFGPRAGVVAAAIAIFTSLALVMLETAGWLPWTVLPYRPLFRWVALVFLIVIMTGLQWVATQTVGSALRRFAAAFDANPTPSTISTLDGRFLAVNEQFLRTTEYTHDEVIGKTALQLGLWPDPEDRRQLMERLQQDGRVRGFEAGFLTKNGERRVLLLSVERIELDGRPCLLHSGQDITERKAAELAARASEERLRALSARLQSAREEEGRRISREIHDELGGALTGLKWDLDGIAKNLQTSPAGVDVPRILTKIPVMRELVESTMAAVRRISSDLRPAVLDDLGLIAAIEWQVQQFQSRADIECEFRTDADTAGLDRERATAVFRILQEILTNVLRHSKATHVSVQVHTQGDAFVLDVHDNGRGISAAELTGARSLGLLGMKERALLAGGDVRIHGEQGRGTTVVVRMPIGSDPVA